MDYLLETIHNVLVKGTVTEQEATIINQLLWSTPLDETLRQALQCLAQGIETGAVALLQTH